MQDEFNGIQNKNLANEIHNDVILPSFLKFKLNDP